MQFNNKKKLEFKTNQFYSPKSEFNFKVEQISIWLHSYKSNGNRLLRNKIFIASLQQAQNGGTKIKISIMITLVFPFSLLETPFSIRLP